MCAAISSIYYGCLVPARTTPGFSGVDKSLIAWWAESDCVRCRLHIANCANTSCTFGGWLLFIVVEFVNAFMYMSHVASSHQRSVRDCVNRHPPPLYGQWFSTATCVVVAGCAALMIFLISPKTWPFTSLNSLLWHTIGSPLLYGRRIFAITIMLTFAHKTASPPEKSDRHKTQDVCVAPEHRRKHGIIVAQRRWSSRFFDRFWPTKKCIKVYISWRKPILLAYDQRLIGYGCDDNRLQRSDRLTRYK